MAGSTAFTKTVSAIQLGLRAGWHIGAQLYVSVNGKPLIDLALGESRPGVGMRSDTLMLWLSAGKPIAAVAIAQLWEAGKLELDDPVARHIPEFGSDNKDQITLRHLLTHTAGLRGAVVHHTREPWEAIIQRICGAKIEPGWVPGKKAGYHVASTWFLLGEIVRRMSGQAFEDYVREKIFEPLGMMDSWFTLSAAAYADYGDRIGILQNTAGADARPHTVDLPEVAILCKPGGSGRGPIRELGRFYEMLLGGGSLNGVQIIRRQTVEALVARHRVGMFDHTFKHIIDWGLGFLLNSEQYGPNPPYGYGPHAGWRTFGHSGNQSSVGFADPKNQLVVAMVFNGTPGDAQHNQRMLGALTAIDEDLNLGMRSAGN